MDTLHVPVDEASLALIEDALNAGFECDEEGNHALVGAEFSINQLLMFWSGYDNSRLIQIDERWSEYPDPVLTRDDIIRALINEIRRIR